MKENKNNYTLLRIRYGLQALFRSKWKWSFPFLYTILYLVSYKHIYKMLLITNTFPFYHLYKTAIEILLILLYTLGLAYIFTVLGTPIGAKRTENNLRRIGFYNSAQETPILVRKFKNKKENTVDLVFANKGISILEFDKRYSELEATLNLRIAHMEYGKNTKTVILHTIPAKAMLTDKIDWKNEYLRDDSFTLVLGADYKGQVIVNLVKTPHILIGGSTGSGKSVLVKCLIMQCILKGATVHISDFKGGVDYSSLWHTKCNIITKEDELLETLTTLVNCLEERKELFRKAETPNLDSYNAKTEHPLQRLIFACDEIAEVLDKTGLGRQEKERVLQIESKLSVIARQGRAFGIHLILATQRPDANILAGQIKNNIDCRICGKADNVLSQIILDSTEAAQKIPKNSQGRFITNEGILFQGYLFNEHDVFQ